MKSNARNCRLGTPPWLRFSAVFAGTCSSPASPQMLAASANSVSRVLASLLLEVRRRQ